VTKEFIFEHKMDLRAISRRLSERALRGAEQYVGYSGNDFGNATKPENFVYFFTEVLPGEIDSFYNLSFREVYTRHKRHPDILIFWLELHNLNPIEDMVYNSFQLLVWYNTRELKQLRRRQDVSPPEYVCVSAEALEEAFTRSAGGYKIILHEHGRFPEWVKEYFKLLNEYPYTNYTGPEMHGIFIWEDHNLSQMVGSMPVPEDFGSILLKHEMIFLIQHSNLPLPFDQYRIDLLRASWFAGDTFVPDVLLEQYVNYYGATNEYSASRVAPLKIEPYAIEFDQGTVQVRKDILNRLGMIVPPGDDDYNYFYFSFISYNEKLNRNLAGLPNLNIVSPVDFRTVLRQLSDREILQYTGAYIWYDNTNTLVKGSGKLLTTPSFFVPIFRKCANTESIVSLSEFGNPEETPFIIAFGTIRSYQCLLLEDLQETFTPITVRIPDTEFEFQDIRYKNPLSAPHPEDPTIRTNLPDFTGTQVSDLQLLLERYQSDEITQFNALIDRAVAIKESNENQESDRPILVAFSRLSPEDKASFKQYLYTVFYLGMFFRRWLGPPQDFPLEEPATKVEVDPDVRAKPLIEQLTKFLERSSSALIDVIKLMRPYNLGVAREVIPHNRFTLWYVPPTNQRVAENIQNALEFRRTHFEDLWHATAYAQECIRMASSAFVVTASRYLLTIFQIRIPGYDQSKLDKIV
jgi:hypothetical protein